MGFFLGRRSQRELVGVSEELIAVVERAIATTPIDFVVWDGMRTQAEQIELVRTGASHTMRSRHLIGEAVDLVPWVAGKPRWEWPLIWPIAEAMRLAASLEGVALTWGGVWDRPLLGLGDLRTAVADYRARQPKDREALVDGPHYELLKRERSDGFATVQAQAEVPALQAAGDNDGAGATRHASRVL